MVVSRGDSTPKRLFTPYYPWEEWFGLGHFTLVRGRHYTVRTYMMEQIIRNAASRRRFSLRLHIRIAADENSLTVTVVGPKAKQRKGRHEPFRRRRSRR